MFPLLKGRRTRCATNAANGFMSMSMLARSGAARKASTSSTRMPVHGREIVESLLLDWERHAAGGAYQIGRPDLNAVRKLLSLPPAAP
jgi:hypothetical protein